MNDFTKGKWKEFEDYLNDGDIGIVVNLDDDLCQTIAVIDSDCDKEDKANAQLISAVGTAATKLAEQGYDAVKVMEMLPELVRVIQDLPSDELIGEAVREALDQCRGEV